VLDALVLALLGSVVNIQAGGRTARSGIARALILLLETAKANGLEPYAYLVDVLTRLPATQTEEEIDDLLPWRWGETIPA